MVAVWILASAPMLAVGPACLPPPRNADGTIKRAALPRETFTIRDRRFHLELALSEAERARGLMERQAIADDGGMLFVYPYAKLLSFWMADCLVDMDIAFLDIDGRITATHRMKIEPPMGHRERRSDYELRLPRYTSEGLAIAAIELQAGQMEAMGLNVGDRVELDLKPLIQQARRRD